MLQPGSTFDRYTIEALLGQGGWGHVFRAMDTRLRRRVALKVLRSERAADGPRLLREARAAAALQHPNVVSIFDMGEANGTPYIAMELVEGEPLSHVARDTAITVSQRIAWMGEIARALGAAHHAGVQHRDVKPQNVMVTRGGAIKVLDFGLAKPVHDASAPASGAPKTQWTFQTRAGYVVGTPRYMSPEAMFGEDCDGRADQYSWGVLAYELLSGAHPRGGDAGPVGAAATVPPLLSELVAGVPFAVAVLVAKTLSYRREDRFPDMATVLVALDSASSPGDEGAMSPRAFVPPQATSLATTAVPTARGSAAQATAVTAAPWQRPSAGTLQSPGYVPAEPPSVVAPPAVVAVGPPPPTTLSSPAYAPPAAAYATAPSPAYAPPPPQPRVVTATRISPGVAIAPAAAAGVGASAESKLRSQARFIRILLIALGSVVVTGLLVAAYALGAAGRARGPEADHPPTLPAACEHYLTRFASCGLNPTARASFAKSAKAMRDAWAKYPPPNQFCAEREHALESTSSCPGATSHEPPVHEPPPATRDPAPFF